MLFEFPVNASSWPDIDPHTPVHPSLIHHPSPQLPSSSFSPTPACPIPSCCLTGGKLGLTGGQAVSQAHRREQRLSPLISSSVPLHLNSNPNPTPPTFLLGEHHADKEVSFIQTGCVNEGFFPYHLCSNVCVYVEDEDQRTQCGSKLQGMLGQRGSLHFKAWKFSRGESLLWWTEMQILVHWGMLEPDRYQGPKV